VVRAVNSAGDAVVDTPLGVVLAAGALPGEELSLHGIRREGRVMRGQMGEIERPSPERVTPSCPHASSCGGCPLAIASPPLERRIKRELLERALEGFEDRPELLWVAAPSSEGYRTRARMHFSAGRLGYRVRRGRGLVDIALCELLVPSLGQALSCLREGVMPLLRGQGQVALALGDAGAVITLETGQSQTSALYSALEALADEPGVAGVAARIGGTAAARFGHPEPVLEGADGASLRVPRGGFAQAQQAVNTRLVRYVAAQAQPAGQRVLELYAGAGNLSVLLAKGAASFESVESSPEAVEAARDNLRARGLAGKLVCGSAEDLAAGGAVDVLVLDPPREGALRALAPALKRRPKRIVYVSCQPSTLGRDLAVLRGAGFQLVALAAFDMFPQTAHIESVVSLERMP